MDNVIKENTDIVIEKLLSFLRKLEIEHKLYNHKEVFNMEDISDLEVHYGK